MDGSDLCRHCGFKRSEHKPAYGTENWLWCPRDMGVVQVVYFDAARPEPEPASRKDFPLFAGCLAYFPDALLAVAKLSKLGNDKHNPGEPLHWAKDKSADHADCIARHLISHGEIDPDTGLSHTVAVAWRALALLQTELESQRGKGGV